MIETVLLVGGGVGTGVDVSVGVRVDVGDGVGVRVGVGVEVGVGDDDNIQLSPTPVGMQLSAIKITRSTLTPRSLPIILTECEPALSERLALVLVEPFR